MRRRALLAAVLVATGATGLAAQAPEGESPAFSAEDDLDCAIYVGALMAEMSDRMSPENRVGLTSALTYFVGRYEAQRGTDLTEAFRERYAIYRERDPAQIEQVCSVRMRAFSNRLQQSGSALSRMQPSAPEGDPGTDANPAK
ncbi:MAG: hypothetical protein WA985_08610 [Erythrobacter sp.]|uniref:hypothetical protein n=1 Tax=Erythrobacter sp. TaxID=1042 RepID=UPI003C719EB0